MPLVMRLETAAAKFDQRVAPASRDSYDMEAADMRDLLLEATKRIKELEAAVWWYSQQTEGSLHETHTCGND